MSAEKQFAQLTQHLIEHKNVVASQMFGKQCLKVNGKAFLALHLKSLVFKLSGDVRMQALAHKGAELWDPSGKGRPMKEWVAIPAENISNAKMLAEHALGYVAESA
ncbi:MAG: hypothetical protein HY273_12830 [Gammaproteobacteria bacterium]|nr:hypothetical protein [Gammaproteobacteria bacterium]